LRLLAFLVLLLSAPSRAIDIEREEYKIIGWNDACSIAVERYAYPVLGQGLYGEPITSRVGTLGIVTAKPTVETRWVFEADGTHTADPGLIAGIRKNLRKAGYDRAGFREHIRDARTSPGASTADVILSTATLEARPDFWPDTTEWRWAWTHYNPLSTCALLIYEQIGQRDRYKFLLTRIYNASARVDRGRAHTTNGRLLFNDGDLADALAETEIGARMAPEIGATRYHYAALLSLNGRLDEAMSEVLAAVKLDASFRAKAATDLDFEPMLNRQDFQERILLRKRPPPMPPP
jgi:tetratricopeptide (TPR) repeat protein